MDWDQEDVREAWWDGYAAYQDDKRLEDNPFCASTQEDLWKAWDAGYWEAGWDN